MSAALPHLPASPRVVIACGGTGGHLFPGLAVAEHLRADGCRVVLAISQKEVDQQAVRGVEGMQILTLPAVGLTRGRELGFLLGLIRSYRAAAAAFRGDPPAAALAMGGFTSAPPVLAARRRGAATFLHESNSVPGRANRWLSWMTGHALVGFPAAAGRLHCRRTTVTGTPVRARFKPIAPAGCRAALGLDPSRPVVLVMGGSQGASGVNSLVWRALPLVSGEARNWQWLHLSGPGQEAATRQAYAAAGLTAVVHPFFAAMETALGAASVVVSRAGASSLAEIAAIRVPAILIPYPSATDNHQWHNARAFEADGAARLLEQHSATPAALLAEITALASEGGPRERMREALARWDKAEVARDIANLILNSCRQPRPLGGGGPTAPGRRDPAAPNPPAAAVSLSTR